MNIEILVAVAIAVTAFGVGLLVGANRGRSLADAEFEDELVDYERRVQTLRDENLRLRLERKLAIQPREILERGALVRSPRVRPWPRFPVADPKA